jgi:ADP-ribose pyrophosphatase YjhB (NUDIX family)
MKFHYLARAIIIIEGKILLANEIGSNYKFLPGGHIDFGESAPKALYRELIEETGLKFQINNFIGAIEHIWSWQEEDNAEINLLFEANPLEEHCVF